MSYGKPFGYKGDERTCYWCGDKLKFSRKWEDPGPNMRPQVVAAFEALPVLLDDYGNPEKRSSPFKHPDLGWIAGGAMYPRVYNGIVTVGPRGDERRQSDGKPGAHPDDDHFCSGQCAQEFGRRAAELGYRLEMGLPKVKK